MPRPVPAGRWAWLALGAGAVALVLTGLGIYWFLEILPAQGELAAARAAYSRGDYTGAQRSLGSVLQHDRDDAVALAELARVKAASGDANAAVPLYAKAVATDPTNAEALHELALLERVMGRTADALVHFKAAVEADPGTLRFVEDLAVTQVQVGHPSDGAIALLAFAGGGGHTDTERAAAYVHAARLEVQLGDTAAARNAAQRAIMLSPGDKDAAELLRTLH